MIKLRLAELCEERELPIVNAAQFGRAVGIGSPDTYYKLWDGEGRDFYSRERTGAPLKMIRLDNLEKIIIGLGLDPEKVTLADLFDGWPSKKRREERRATRKATVTEEAKRPFVSHSRQLAEKKTGQKRKAPA